MQSVQQQPVEVRLKQQRQAMIHLEPNEVLAILKAAKQHGSREWCMILLAYRHGLRASEVCSLRLNPRSFKFL